MLNRFTPPPTCTRTPPRSCTSPPPCTSQLHTASHLHTASQLYLAPACTVCITASRRLPIPHRHAVVRCAPPVYLNLPNTKRTQPATLLIPCVAPHLPTTCTDCGSLCADKLQSVNWLETFLAAYIGRESSSPARRALRDKQAMVLG